MTFTYPISVAVVTVRTVCVDGLLTYGLTTHDQFGSHDWQLSVRDTSTARNWLGFPNPRNVLA
jgi:hypothetical protein